MQFIKCLFQSMLLVHDITVEHARFFGLFLHFAIQVGAQTLKVARAMESKSRVNSKARFATRGVVSSL